jgi:hypothetical protein
LIDRSKRTRIINFLRNWPFKTTSGSIIPSMKDFTAKPLASVMVHSGFMICGIAT